MLSSAATNHLLNAAETNATGTVRHLAKGVELSPVDDDLVWFPLTAVIGAETGAGGIHTGWIGREGAIGLVRLSQASAVRWIVQQEGNAVAIRRSVVHNQLLISPAFSDAIMSWLARSAENAMQIAALNAQADAFDRVARLLTEFREYCGSEPLSIRQAEVARLLGLQRTTVSGIMSRMRAMNVVKYQRGRVTFFDPSVLQAA